MEARGTEIKRQEGDHHLIAYEIPDVFKDETVNMLRKYWLVEKNQ